MSGQADTTSALFPLSHCFFKFAPLDDHGPKTRL